MKNKTCRPWSYFDCFIDLGLYEPRYEKTGFLHMRKQRRRSAPFVFAIRIVQPLYYLNPKFQALSHLLWFYSPVCVRPGRKIRRPVFSQRGSYSSILYTNQSWATIFDISHQSLPRFTPFAMQWQHHYLATAVFNFYIEG